MLQPYVLVVDDEPDVSELVVAALGEERWPAVRAGGGAEALALLDEALAPPSLILVDLLMPGLDGAAFARAYHRRPGPHAPLVLFTAAMPTEALMVELGITAVLSKPFEMAELMELAARHVPRRAA